MCGERKTESETGIQDLPPEMLDYILQLLPLWDRKRTRLVSSLWLRILDDRCLRKYQFCVHLNKAMNVDYFFKSSLNFEKVDMGWLTKDLPLITRSRNKFPPFRVGTLHCGNSGHNVITFLKYGSEHMECLRVEELSLANVSNHEMSIGTPEMKWNVLNELKLKITWIGPGDVRLMKKHLDALCTFLKLAKTPHLRKFEAILSSGPNILIEEIDRPEQYAPILGLFAKIYGFLSRHTESLNSLSFVLNSLRILIPLDPPDVTDLIQENISKNLALTSLEIWYNYHRVTALVLPCLLPSKGLEKLQWISSDPTEGRDHEENDQILQELINKNAKSLVEVAIRNPPNFQIHWLNRCTSLKSLSLGTIEAHENFTIPTLESLELMPLHALPENYENWIIQRYPNLTSLKIYPASTGMDIPALQILLGLPFLRQMYIWGLTRENARLVKQFCANTIGLSVQPTSGIACYSYGNGRLLRVVGGDLLIKKVAILQTA